MATWQNLDIVTYEGVGKYNIPEINPVHECEAVDWLGFPYVLQDRRVPWKKEQTGVHFFVNDYRFERCWNDPTRYGEILLRYKCVLSPDFSLFTSFPKAIQIYNHYKKHWLARFWQEDMGLTVIPTITWGDESTYDFCFDGEPKHSVVAVSNVGCVKYKGVHELFLQGYNEMLKRLDPELILVYSKSVHDYPGNVKYIFYEHNKKKVLE